MQLNRIKGKCFWRFTRATGINLQSLGLLFWSLFLGAVGNCGWRQLSLESHVRVVECRRFGLVQNWLWMFRPRTKNHRRCWNGPWKVNSVRRVLFKTWCLHYPDCVPLLLEPQKPGTTFFSHLQSYLLRSVNAFQRIKLGELPLKWRRVLKEEVNLHSNVNTDRFQSRALAFNWRSNPFVAAAVAWIGWLICIKRTLRTSRKKATLWVNFTSVMRNVHRICSQK